MLKSVKSNQKVNAKTGTPKTKVETQETESANITVLSSPPPAGPDRQPDAPVQCQLEPAPNSETPAQTASKRSTTIVDTGLTGKPSQKKVTKPFFHRFVAEPSFACRTLQTPIGKF